VLFNSYVFLFLFLPVALWGWWRLPAHRLVFLTVISFVFYGYWWHAPRKRYQMI
jgi:alginate O-acetyltransferase complex protein AlgI